MTVHDSTIRPNLLTSEEVCVAFSGVMATLNYTFEPDDVIYALREIATNDAFWAEPDPERSAEGSTDIAFRAAFGTRDVATNNPTATHAAAFILAHAIAMRRLSSALTVRTALYELATLLGPPGPPPCPARPPRAG